MELKDIANEFCLIRDKLHRIAQSLNGNNPVEANFLIGCLHNIAHENGEKIKKLLNSKENI